MDPIDLTAIELREAIAAGHFRAVDVVEAYLARIEALDGELGCYRETWPDRARERARQVDAGALTGPLAGVPVAVKDNLCTDHGLTACGSRMLENYRSPFTATAVARLEAAGGIILGKTNMDEFAMGGSTESSYFGRTVNPWDRSRVPGGSSGGSAAAVAARLCTAALGSDTGGSIRQPAAYCGIVGLKPSYGRVSRWGLVAFASSLDQIGPMTHSVGDAALLLGIIAGHDPLDSTCVEQRVPDYLAGLESGEGGGETAALPMRIGVARQYLGGANHAAVEQAIEQAREVLAAQGAQLVEIDLPHTEYGVPTYYLVATSEASSNLARYDGVHYGHRTEAPVEDLVELYSRSRAEGFGDEVKRRIMLGTFALSSGYFDQYYARALKARRLIRQDFDRAFQQCDVILTPTATDPAFRLGEKLDDPLAMYLNDVYTANCNLAGLPAISLPAGLAEGEDGTRLPVGLQLIGPLFQEETLLQAAHRYQRHTDWHTLHPPL